MIVGVSLTFSFLEIIRRLLLFARSSYYFTPYNRLTDYSLEVHKLTKSPTLLSFWPAGSIPPPNDWKLTDIFFPIWTLWVRCVIRENQSTRTFLQAADHSVQFVQSSQFYFWCIRTQFQICPIWIQAIPSNTCAKKPVQFFKASKKSKYFKFQTWIFFLPAHWVLSTQVPFSAGQIDIRCHPLYFDHGQNCFCLLNSLSKLTST